MKDNAIVVQLIFVTNAMVNPTDGYRIKTEDTNIKECEQCTVDYCKICTTNVTIC